METSPFYVNEQGKLCVEDSEGILVCVGVGISPRFDELLLVVE
jgi:hypothetical protein